VDIGELSKWATPERIEFVSELPRTSVGKLDKKAMRANYANIAK
jgi:fatty-acyl-CoA synthase